MILNIYGPSGSGKTTLIKYLLMSDNLQNFYKTYVPYYKIKKSKEFNTSLSLIPIPYYRGSIKEFLEIHCIDLKDIKNLKRNLKDLFNTIFHKFEKDNIEKIENRRIETLSAGEMRRFFILKSLLMKADIFIIDEPFSNSDKNLWEIIMNSFSKNKNYIIISHFPLNITSKFESVFTQVNINSVENKFLDQIKNK